MRLVVAVLIFAAAFASAQAFGQSNPPVLMTPGLWEITVQLEAPDPGPAMTTQECVTAERSRPASPRRGRNDDCQIVDVPAPGNQVVYTVNCSRLKRTSRSQFTYLGDRFEGTVTTDFGKVQVVTKYTARRIGECQPDSSGTAAAEE